MKTLVQDFVCHKLLFSKNKENFRIFDNISFWGRVSEILIFFRIFWSDLVGATDILLATDIVNMLSLLKRL